MLSCIRNLSLKIRIIGIMSLRQKTNGEFDCVIRRSGVEYDFNKKKETGVRPVQIADKLLYEGTV